MVCKKGDIVYWCENCGNGDFQLRWGIVDEVYYDKVAVDFLEPKECRYIHADWMRPDEWVYLPEFEDTRWHELPKGWTYDTPLFEITQLAMPVAWLYDVKLDDPDSIIHAYNSGDLVKSSTIFHGNVESVITKDGYQIQKRYPMWQKRHVDYTGVDHHKIRLTYEEAEAEVVKSIEEILRQCSLTDEEWAWEQIEKDIDRYCIGNGYKKDDPHISAIRDYFADMPDIFSVETRISGGKLQWKLEKNKRWLDISL